MAESDADVVIVGSGAGGGAMAYGLAAQGVRVLLLDAGPAYDPFEDYRLDRADWEATRFPHKIRPEGRQSFAPLQPLDARFEHLRSWNRAGGRMVAGDRRAAWGYHHVVGVGGSTLAFTGEAHRLHPRAFTMRRDFGIGADWPLDYAELEPYYLAAERVIGVSGPADAGPRWRSAPYPLPPHDLAFASRRLQQGAAGLGLNWTANSVVALSRPHDGRPGCNYCGNCQRGCPRLDKGSVDVTFIAKAVATGYCTVQPESVVLRLVAGGDDRVAEVIVAGLGGEERLRPKAVVVACGAVETPRLLLASDSLANDSGQVGRNFLETLAWVSTGLADAPLGSHRGLPADSGCWDYSAPDAIPGVVGGARFGVGQHEADLVGPIGYAQRLVAGFGRAHQAAMRAAFGRALSVVAVGECLPNPGSFIDLDPDKRDARGVPLARIHSLLGDEALRRLDFMARTARDILRAAGVGDLVEEYGAYDAFNSTHVFGTCRMGADPSQSVVDRDCRSHRWRNLYVVDASVFPSTGGGEAPSLTIEALALRAADRLAERGRRGEL